MSAELHEMYSRYTNFSGLPVLKEVYKVKAAARVNLAEATWELYSAEMKLKSRETAILVLGKIVGGNERGRKATLDNQTIEEQMIVGDCKLRQIMNQRDFDIASDAVRLQRELWGLEGGR